MSGRFVVSAAARFNNKIKASALFLFFFFFFFYGVIVTQKKKKRLPHLLANKSYLAFAEHDIWVPKSIRQNNIYFFKFKNKIKG